jgi:hypothetical protein
MPTLYILDTIGPHAVFSYPQNVLTTTTTRNLLIRDGFSLTDFETITNRCNMRWSSFFRRGYAPVDIPGPLTRDNFIWTITSYDFKFVIL